MVSKLPKLKQAIERAKECLSSVKYQIICLKILPIYTQEDVHKLIASLETLNASLQKAVSEKVENLLHEKSERELVVK